MRCHKCGSETPIGHRCIVEDLEAIRTADLHGAWVEVEARLEDQRHWKNAPHIARADRPIWVAIDEALRPFVACDEQDHHPSCCPAVQAVMAAFASAFQRAGA